MGNRENGKSRNRGNSESVDRSKSGSEKKSDAEVGGSGGDDGPHQAIVDGANVAHSTEGESARLQNIRLVCDKLEEEGFKPIIVVDAALRHSIDDRQQYERMVDAGTIRQAPAGTDADYFILSFARELDAYIVSNDRYRDRIEKFPEARERLIRYMIVENEVVFEKRARARD